jgi:hypothetical protein
MRLREMPSDIFEIEISNDTKPNTVTLAVEY